MFQNTEKMHTESQGIREMSPEEFKKSLLTWFENQGIISELRAHLRHQMMENLKNTSLQRNISQSYSYVSMKTEAINLLIAEYLMKSQYYYSLSVFSTEIPEGNMSQIDKSLAANTKFDASNINKPLENFKFAQQHFWYILNALDFTRDSVQTKKIYDSYFNQPDESLLICIINCLSNIYNNKPEKDISDDNIKNKEYFNKIDPLLKNIFNVLIHFQIPDDILFDIFEHIQELLKREKDIIKNEESLKQKVFHAEIQKDMHDRELQISHIINEMEDTFLKEKQLLTEDINKEYVKIKRLNEILEQKESDYDTKIIELNNREDNLNQRETEIEKHLNILQVNANIKKENKKIQTNLQTEIKLIKETERTENTSQKCEEDENVFYRENVLQLIKDLQKENSQLKMINQDLEKQTRELSSNNLSLLMDLDKAAVVIKKLTKKNNEEKLGYVSQPTFQGEDKKVHLFKKVNRNTTMENTDSSSEENTQTESILKEAKQRLQKLEEETKAVDQNYRAFKQRHLQSLENSRYYSDPSTSKNSLLNSS